MNVISKDASDTKRVSTNECISTETAKNRLTGELWSALPDAENTLIEAPTSLGKTHTIATTAWRNYPDITGGEPVIQLHQTTEARDQAAKMSKDAGIDYKVLKGRDEQCPVAHGDYDDEHTAPDGGTLSEWFDNKCNGQGFAFSEVHKHLERELGKLPCQQQEDGCGMARQRVNVPRNGDGEPEYDIIHATHQFAHVSKLIKDANVVIDEQPDYEKDIKQEGRRFRRAVNDLLERLAPNSRYTWPKLITAVADGDDETLAEYRNLLGQLSDKPEPIGDGDTHRLAPKILRAVVSSEPQVNNRFAGEHERATVVFKDNGDIQVVRRRPAFPESRCVVGLDAHPSPLLWEKNTGADLRHTEVLERRERREWRQTERGLRVIQIGNDTRPLTRGWWPGSSQHLQAKAIIQEVHRQHGNAFRTCITPLRIEDDVEKFMIEDNIENAEIMHYGEQNSRNDFENEKVGLLLGCIDPGDEYILDMLAEEGLEAEPKRGGREFVGPDADAAREFLESVREANVAQAIGRYARNAEDSERVTVYAWTDAIPEHLVDGEAPGTTTEVTGTKLAMLKVAHEQGPVTAKEVSEKVGCGKEHVRQSFKDMKKQGIITISKGTGSYGADEYHTDGKELLPVVDLHPED